MSLEIFRDYEITTISGVTAIRTFIGRSPEGETLFRGKDKDGRTFQNAVRGTDNFIISIRPVPVAA